MTASEVVQWHLKKYLNKNKLNKSMTIAETVSMNNNVILDSTNATWKKIVV